MHSHCINNLINIKDVIVKKVVQNALSVEIFLETKPQEQVCPYCKQTTRRIHDYRMQVIKDLPFQMKHCYLVLRKRRYVCSCGKRFFENYSFLPRYFHRTSRLTYAIANALRSTESIFDISKRYNVSTATVSRILDTISFSKPQLPRVLSIDEFKGNAETGKYQCILVDPIKREILDILPDRTQSHLIDYFRSYPGTERRKVDFFVCDMWKQYTDLARIYFPNATIIIDKYHFIRQVTWAIERVRKRLQKNMAPELRKYYKRSRTLILTRYSKLQGDLKRECDIMLLYNDDLRLAHYLKEDFYKLCQNPNYKEQKEAFYDWIKMAEKSGLREFEDCAATYRNWQKEILNAFKYAHITNGPTEGFNNKIKVLKRSAYGVKNFRRFRTRILLSTH